LDPHEPPSGGPRGRPPRALAHDRRLVVIPAHVRYVGVTLGQVVEGSVAASQPTGLPPVRLVATDLDGTLLRPDGTISERTIRAVRSARNAGLHVIPITGRPPRVTWDVAKEAGLGPLGVCSNGAALVDISAMEVIEVETLGRDVAAEVVPMVRELFPGAVFAVEEMESFTHEAGFIDPDWNWDEGTNQVDDIIEAVTPGCIKLIVRRPGWPARHLLSQLNDRVAENLHFTSSGLDWVEIGAQGISKAYATERACHRLGVAVGEVLAVGDNYNDLTVLAWAGRTAAPANAIPEVLSIVQQVLPANCEDGVAVLLEALAAGITPPGDDLSS
jgi:Cof subfamily protein (haloacid dehalogenase superfamily)